MLTAVIGTGTWGTASAAQLAHAGHPVLLWGRDAAKTAALTADHAHPQLPGCRLPDHLVITADPATLAGADLILWAVPTQHTRASARHLHPFLSTGTPVVSLSKGLEEGSLLRVSEVLAAELGPRPYACLSGPAMAPEIAIGRPAALVAAGDDATCRQLVERLHGPRLRIYTSPDLIGVELAGALKNVVAVAAGLCEGMGLGDNAKAALITRGLAEMRRLGRALGALDATFAGLAGVGDLLTTCYSSHGRNRALGLALAAGTPPRDLLTRGGPVAEGAWTCRAAVELGRRAGIELPIAFQVASVIWNATPVAFALDQLLARAPKEEDA
jgi:glycerol-3-phosphate dehydrogenase (NAD(P)+)